MILKADAGRTIEESKEIVRYLDGLGIDAFDLDAGCYEHKQWICPSIYTGDAPMLKWVEQFKGVTDKPIFSSGMYTPELGEKALAEGKIDAVMFGRQSIADPDLPNKLLAGDREDVRPCLACNEICVGRLYQNRPISCAVIRTVRSAAQLTRKLYAKGTITLRKQQRSGRWSLSEAVLAEWKLLVWLHFRDMT